MLIIQHANAQISTTIRTTTITYPTVSLDCNFEKDFCNWANYSSNDVFTWQRNKGSTLSDLTGPLTDHTLQTIEGHYIYIEVTEIINLFKEEKLNCKILNRLHHQRSLMTRPD